MVDTRDLKSLASNEACRFKSGLRHFFELSQPPYDTGIYIANAYRLCCAETSTHCLFEKQHLPRGELAL
jgi:hypothetical protein